jgi:hypothetical protein
MFPRTMKTTSLPMFLFAGIFLAASGRSHACEDNFDSPIVMDTYVVTASPIDDDDSDLGTTLDYIIDSGSDPDSPDDDGGVSSSDSSVDATTPDPPPPDVSPPVSDPIVVDSPPPDPPPSPDPVVVDPPAPPDPPPAPPTPVADSPLPQPSAPIADTVRMRLHATGHEAYTSGPLSVGHMQIWTDPANLQATPWPSFQNPQPAAVQAQNTVLPPTTAASQN